MRLLFLSFLVLNGILAQSCPPNFSYNSNLGTCLSTWNFFSSWTSANFYCNFYGGSLISIHNSAQNSLVASIENTQSKDNRGWLGLQNAMGNWTWTDGTPYDYQNFMTPANPNQCVYLDSQDLAWKSADCSVQLPFLCAATPGTGTPATTTTGTTTTTPQSNLTCQSPNQQDLYVCQQGWVTFPQTGKQYMVAFDMSFTDGEAYCVSQGGHLASIHSDAENNFITNLCCASGCNAISPDERYGQYVVGGSEINGQFTWTDGTPFDYQGRKCFEQGQNQEGLLLSNYANCDVCGSPGSWFWENTNYIIPYAVCKK